VQNLQLDLDGIEQRIGESQVVEVLRIVEREISSGFKAPTDGLVSRLTLLPRVSPSLSAAARPAAGSEPERAPVVLMRALRSRRSAALSMRGEISTVGR
jgi:hypothetical protein